jgi:hypothetical protein
MALSHGIDRVDADHFCQGKPVDHPLNVPQRGKAPAPFWLAHAGMVVCGLAAGLHEFVALQRWRLKQRHLRGTGAARR